MSGPLVTIVEEDSYPLEGFETPAHELLVHKGNVQEPESPSRKAKHARTNDVTCSSAIENDSWLINRDPVKTCISRDAKAWQCLPFYNGIPPLSGCQFCSEGSVTVCFHLTICLALQGARRQVPKRRPACVYTETVISRSETAWSGQVRFRPNVFPRHWHTLIWHHGLIALVALQHKVTQWQSGGMNAGQDVHASEPEHRLSGIQSEHVMKRIIPQFWSWNTGHYEWHEGRSLVGRLNDDPKLISTDWLLKSCRHCLYPTEWKSMTGAPVTSQSCRSTH